MIDFFRSPAFLKLISLCAAIGLWVVVTTNVSSLTITVPVEVRNVPDDTLLISSSVTQVSLRVRGPSFLLNTGVDGLKAIRVAVPKDVSHRLVVPIQSSDLPLPSGLSIASVEPSEVELRFDKKATKVVPVEVPRIGRLSDSYRLGGIQWKPEVVQVEGPLELIRDLRQVETYPIDFRTLTESEKKELPIRKPASSMTLSADQVTVVVEVSPIPVKRVFRRQPIEVRVNGGDPRTVSPKEVQVTVRGPKSLMQPLSEGDIVPYVRLDEDDPPGSFMSVSAVVPDGMEVVSINPPSVEVRGAPLPASSSPAAVSTKKSIRVRAERSDRGSSREGARRPALEEMTQESDAE